MNRIYSIPLAAALMLALAATFASAQQLPDHGEEGHLHTPVCGFQWADDGHDAEGLAATAATNPALYHRILASRKEPIRPTLAADGEVTFPFLIRKRVAPYDFYEVTGVLAFEGKYGWIWIDARDTGRVKLTSSFVRNLAKGLDSVTGNSSRNPTIGIIQNDIEVFGEPPAARSFGGVTHFLMTDIDDGFTGGAFVAGFFSPFDQTDQAGSNKINMLYIDSREGVASGITSVLNTMAHEFQHLIHYNTYRESDIVYNEGCSELASIICGYANRGNAGYRGNTNVNLFRWSRDDQSGALLLADYERAMTFAYYLWDQFGEDFIRTFNSTQVSGIDRIKSALQATGKGSDWRDVLTGFGVANYVLTGYPDRRYTYDDPLTSGRPTPEVNFSGTDFPKSGNLGLAAYGIDYLVYTNPGGMKATFSSSRNISVLSIAYEGSNPVQVQKLNLGEPYQFGGSKPYDKVVFVLVNTEQDPNTATIEWQLESVSLGVDREITADRSFGFTSVAPNPVSGRATIGFVARGGGDVSLELFDTRGEQVLAPLSDRPVGAGEQSVTVDLSTLPNGLYVARLRQGDQVVSRTITVVH